MNLAPIVLFVYNRPWHTEQTLNALALNNLADKSVLYIYCDGPKKNALEEDLKKINEVRQLVKSKQWCKEVIVIENDINLGLANSVIKGVTEVIEKHGRIIVLEDDLLTGKYFIDYMNKSLNYYDLEKKVFGVTGYQFPHSKKIAQSTYFLPIMSSWSYGTWLDRWEKVNFNTEELLDKFTNEQLKSKFNFGGYPYYEMLVSQNEGKIDSWAIRFYASMFLNGAYFHFPNKSLIQNIGFDNSGTHCGSDSFFKNIKKSNYLMITDRIEVALNKKIVDDFKKNFEMRNKTKKKSIMERILKKIKNIIKNI